MADRRADRARAIAELQRLIDGIPVAMVTTVAADDRLRSRPMLVERVEPDATLVFLTHRSSQKAGEVEREARVNVAFVGTATSRSRAVRRWYTIRSG